MMAQKEGEIFIYDWYCNEKDKDSTCIRAYGLDINNHSICLKIKDYNPYVYVELPEKIQWTETKIKILIKYMKDNMKESHPLTATLVRKRKLYYAHNDYDNKPKLFNYLCLTFRTKWHIYSLMRVFSGSVKILEINNNSYVYNIHESDVSCITQMLCIQNIPSCGWVKFKGQKIEDVKKESSCEEEYKVNWTSLNKVNKETLPSPLMLSFDIEVYSSRKTAMPSYKIDEDEIFQISMIFKRQNDPTEECYLLSLVSREGKEIKEENKPNQNIVGKNVKILSFIYEDQLLYTFSKIIREKNPQIIMGYNIMGFDYEYMFERWKLLPHLYWVDDQDNGFNHQGCIKNKNGELKAIKWSSSAYRNQYFKYIESEGRIIIDLLPVIKRDYNLDNYKLDTVSEFFLKEQKDPVTPQKIFKYYEIGMQGGLDASNKLGIIGKYCIKDSLLVMKLFEHLLLWYGVCEMAKTCNISIFDVYTRGQQLKVFSQVYKYCRDNNFVIDKHGYEIKDNEFFQGAKVLNPKPGIYNKVAPFDFASLYPSAIMSHNIDYSTLVNKDFEVSDDLCHVIKFEEHVGCEHDFQLRKTKVDKKICGVYNYRFLKEPKGVIPSLLQNLIDARKNTNKKIEELKNLKKEEKDEEKLKEIENTIKVLDKRQLSFKVSANSMYGSMGVQKGYLPFMPGAMCTTAIGRQSLDKASKYIKENYNGNIIYGDTDSVMVIFPQVSSAEETWNFCLKVAQEMQSIFPPPMKLEFEKKLYWKFFILTKKRYMWLECGKDGIVSDKLGKKGVLLARRGNSKFEKEVYSDLIKNIIINDYDQDTTLYQLIQKLNLCCSFSIPRKEFIITTSIKEIDEYKIKPLSNDLKKKEKRLKELGCTEEEYNIFCLPAQIQLAEKMRKRGKLVPAGARIEYIISKTNDLNANLRKKIEEPDYQRSIVKLDYLYYIHKMINPIDEVLNIRYNIPNFLQQQYKVREKYNMVLSKLQELQRKRYESKFIVIE